MIHMNHVFHTSNKPLVVGSRGRVQFSWGIIRKRLHVLVDQKSFTAAKSFSVQF